jgi:hypothetical protein
MEGSICSLSALYCMCIIVCIISFVPLVRIGIIQMELVLIHLSDQCLQVQAGVSSTLLHAVPGWNIDLMDQSTDTSLM